MIIGVLAGYVFWPSSTTDRIEQQGSGADANQDQAEIQDTAARRLLSTRSTPEEVYAAQGAPTRTDGDIWYYGDARVYFREGRVTHWIDTFPPQLATGGIPPALAEQARLNEFGRGSSKPEVRAIQGTPMRETEATWDYGLSRVYFDQHGQVSGWSESPMDPLRVRR